MGNKINLSDFELDLIVGARKADSSISEIANFLGFLVQQSLTYSKNCI